MKGFVFISPNTTINSLPNFSSSHKIKWYIRTKKSNASVCNALTLSVVDINRQPLNTSKQPKYFESNSALFLIKCFTNFLFLFFTFAYLQLRQDFWYYCYYHYFVSSTLLLYFCFWNFHAGILEWVGSKISHVKTPLFLPPPSTKTRNYSKGTKCQWYCCNIPANDIVATYLLQYKVHQHYVLIQNSLETNASTHHPMYPTVTTNKYKLTTHFILKFVNCLTRW